MPKEPLERMREDFISESYESLQKLSHELSSMDPESSEPDELVNALFRKAHSVKGTAGMFDLFEVSLVAGAIENVLEEVRSGRIPLSREAVETVLEGLDEIVLLLREARGEEVGADADGVIGRIGSFLGASPPAVGTEDPLQTLKSVFPAGSLDNLMRWESEEIAECLRSGKRVVHLALTLEGRSLTEAAAEILPDLDTFGRVLGVPRPEGVTRDRFAVIFVVEKAEDAFDGFVSERKAEIIDAAYPGLKSRAGDGQSAPAKKTGPAEIRPDAMTVKVDISILDSLMNAVSELYSVRFKLAEVGRSLAAGLSGRRERDDVLKLGLHLTQRIGEIETAVMEARLVPVSLLFNRYTNEVRRLARKQGKKIDLIFEGEATRMDRALLEEMYDPVLHLLRNAVDHGIETIEERLRSGKPERGRIALRARQECNHVRIDIEDDGAGFDYEMLEKIARDKGLDDFSCDDLVDLIFEPGVSTKSEVTEVSGRGVGLDEVKVHVESLRGVVGARSEPGRGTCFSLLVPLTLAVSRGVVFEEDDLTAVLPITYVEEIIPYRGRLRREIEGSGFADTIRHGKVQTCDLADLLGATRADVPKSIVIVRVGDDRHAMVVGRVWGETDIAARPLPESMLAAQVVTGATELHDRRPAVIVQPEPFLRGRMANEPGRGWRMLDSYPADLGLARMEDADSFLSLGLFETPAGLAAVPIDLLRQVVPMRPVAGAPVFGQCWRGIFFERGLCHGLLKLGVGGNGDDGLSKIAIMRFPERCGVGVKEVIGEIQVPAAELETVSSPADADAPVRVAARFDLDDEKVDVIDLVRGDGRKD
jgi:two-component system chemotaxis sensor kinase CheA